MTHSFPTRRSSDLGNAGVAGCRASIVQGVDTVVQLLLIAGEGEDLVIETTIAPQIGPPQRRLAWRIIRRKVGTGTLGHAGADLVRPPIPVHVPELEGAAGRPFAGDRKRAVRGKRES